MSEPESLAVEEGLDKHVRRHAVDRLVMLSDGVFAIAITLAALEIHIPNAPTLSAVVEDLGVPILAYLVSFQVIAVFWISNRDLFARVHTVDRVLTGLILAILCLTALIPSSIRVAGPSAGYLGGAFQFYALVMTLTGSLNCLAWIYASFRRGVMRTDVAPGYRWTRIAETATLPMIFGLVFAFPTVQMFKTIAFITILVLIARRGLVRLIVARAELNLPSQGRRPPAN